MNLLLFFDPPSMNPNLDGPTDSYDNQYRRLLKPKSGLLTLNSTNTTSSNSTNTTNTTSSNTTSSKNTTNATNLVPPGSQGW